MTCVLLRKAITDDATAIAELSGQLGYRADSAAIRARLERLLPDAEHHICVAVVDGVIAGWAHTLVALRVESAPFAELTGLVVDQNRRRCGLGRQLVEDADQWAARQQLAQLRVQTNELRSGTHHFYAALGFLPSKVQRVVTRTVGERPDAP